VTTRWFGERVQRVEDDRLLRGHGRFTDDIDEGALESCLVRSPYAHARIRSIDVSAARALPGVVAVYTAADLPFGQTDLPILIPHPNLTHGRTQRCLASEVVRYVGEAVAFIVAESRTVLSAVILWTKTRKSPLSNSCAATYPNTAFISFGRSGSMQSQTKLSLPGFLPSCKNPKQGSNPIAITALVNRAVTIAVLKFNIACNGCTAPRAVN